MDGKVTYHFILYNLWVQSIFASESDAFYVLLPLIQWCERGKKSCGKLPQWRKAIPQRCGREVNEKFLL